MRHKTRGPAGRAFTAQRVGSQAGVAISPRLGRGLLPMCGPVRGRSVVAMMRHTALDPVPTSATAPVGLTLLIADSHPLARAGLRRWLGTSHTTIEVRDLLGALRAVNDRGVDVAVVDARLAGLATPAARDGLRALASRVPVVVIGMADAPAAYVAAVVAAGGAGYWPKDGDPGALLRLVETVARDGARVFSAATPVRLAAG